VKRPTTRDTAVFELFLSPEGPGPDLNQQSFWFVLQYGGYIEAYCKLQDRHEHHPPSLPFLPSNKQPPILVVSSQHKLRPASDNEPEKSFRTWGGGTPPIR